MTSIFTGLEFFSKLNGSEMLMMRLNALGMPRESHMAALRSSRLFLIKVTGGSKNNLDESREIFGGIPKKIVPESQR